MTSRYRPGISNEDFTLFPVTAGHENVAALLLAREELIVDLESAADYVRAAGFLRPSDLFQTFGGFGTECEGEFGHTVIYRRNDVPARAGDDFARAAPLRRRH